MWPRLFHPIILPLISSARANKSSEGAASLLLWGHNQPSAIIRLAKAEELRSCQRRIKLPQFRLARSP